MRTRDSQGHSIFVRRLARRPMPKRSRAILVLSASVSNEFKYSTCVHDGHIFVLGGAFHNGIAQLGWVFHGVLLISPHRPL
jgi:hypothetical protein